MTEVETLPKLCHVCGMDVGKDREWMYQRSGAFDPIRARCVACQIADDRRDAAQELRDAQHRYIRHLERALAYARGDKVLGS